MSLTKWQLLLTACAFPNLVLSLGSGYLMCRSLFPESRELSILSAEQLKNMLALSSNPHLITAPRGPTYRLDQV